MASPVTAELRVTAREALEALWLPWCVGRHRRTEIIRIADEPDRRHEAMQLRVGDLADGEIREALATQPFHDTRSLPYIAALAETFAHLAAVGYVVIPDALIFPTLEGPMLHEASHRSCAIYEAGLQRFEIRAVVHPIAQPWQDYHDSRLRRR